MADREVRLMAFDVNETLFSLDRLGSAFTAGGLDPASVPLWFARLLRDGFALTAMGMYQPFGDLAAAALRSLDPDRVDALAVETVLGAFRQLDPHPDVEPALRLLRDAGVPAITLTNGSADLVGALVTRAGLDGFFQRSLSVDVVRRWKPAPEPYLWAAEHMGVAPGQVALLAAHPWDCAGARAAGLTSVWINRTGQEWPGVFPPPDVTGRDMPSAVSAVLNRPLAT